jgi:hypothetical protein
LLAATAVAGATAHTCTHGGIKGRTKQSDAWGNYDVCCPSTCDTCSHWEDSKCPTYFMAGDAHWPWDPSYYKCCPGWIAPSVEDHSHRGSCETSEPPCYWPIESHIQIPDSLPSNYRTTDTRSYKKITLTSWASTCDEKNMQVKEEIFHCGKCEGSRHNQVHFCSEDFTTVFSAVYQTTADSRCDLVIGDYSVVHIGDQTGTCHVEKRQWRHGHRDFATIIRYAPVAELQEEVVV